MRAGVRRVMGFAIIGVGLLSAADPAVATKPEVLPGSCRDGGGQYSVDSGYRTCTTERTYQAAGPLVSKSQYIGGSGVCGGSPVTCYWAYGVVTGTSQQVTTLRELTTRRQRGHGDVSVTIATVELSTSMVRGCFLTRHYLAGDQHTEAPPDPQDLWECEKYRLFSGG